MLEHDPDHIDARLDLARNLRRLGNLADAIVQTRGAFDRAGQPLDIAEELYWLLCEADDRQGAIDLLTLLDDDRSDAEALATIVRLDLGLGRITEARAILPRISAQDAEAGTIVSAEIDLVTGDLDMDTNEPFAAYTAQTIPETSPHFANARRIAGAAMLAGDLPKRALEVVEPARRAKPTDPDLALVAATALADTGSPADARKLLRDAGDSDELQLARARLEDHLHDATAALAILEPFLRAHPHNVTALNLAGYMLADHKLRLDDAERYLHHARELAPGDPAILDSWGWLQFRRGRTRDAIRALDHATRFAPREPEILLHLATVWAADHDPKTALDLLTTATQLHPPKEVAGRIDALRATLVIR